MNVFKMMGIAAALVLLISSVPSNGTELLTNGTFEGGFTVVTPHRIPMQWTVHQTTPGEVSLIYDINMNGPSQPGSWCWEFSRTDVLQSGDWTSIEQTLAIPVANYMSLTLSVDVQVLSHNLEAGGWQQQVPAFEWPAIVQIDYTDVTNTPQTWRYGWYLDSTGDSVLGPINDPGGGLIPFYNDASVPPSVWVSGTFNLLTELPQAWMINRIRVGGSGWSFHSIFDNVSIDGVLGPVTADALSWGGVKALYR